MNGGNSKRKVTFAKVKIIESVKTTLGTELYDGK
jgi:hypothetical protein